MAKTAKKNTVDETIKNEPKDIEVTDAKEETVIAEETDAKVDEVVEAEKVETEVKPVEDKVEPEVKKEETVTNKVTNTTKINNPYDFNFIWNGVNYEL